MRNIIAAVVLSWLCLAGGCAECKDCSSFVLENPTPLVMRYQVDAGFSHVTGYGVTDEVAMSRSSPHVLTIDYGQVIEHRDYRFGDDMYGRDRRDRVGWDHSTTSDDLIIRPELHRILHLSWDAGKGQWVVQEDHKPDLTRITPGINVGPVGPPVPMGPVGR